MIASVVECGALEIVRGVGDEIVGTQSLNLLQKLVDLSFFELLSRDGTGHLPRVLDVGVSLEEPVEPVAMRSVLFEGMEPIHRPQNPHYQLPHIFAWNSHLLLLQLDDEVGKDALLVRRQDSRLARLVAPRLHHHRTERRIRIERRRVRPGHLGGNRLLLAIFAVRNNGRLVALLGEDVIEHGAKVGVVD